MDGEPNFLGFEAFETTAFCTAILVALYSLIRNPQGRQTAKDHSEYEVYSGWRRAIAVVFVQIILLIVVLVHTRINGTSSRATGWLLASMIAPWAPLAGQVRRTLSAWRKVRSMMVNRLTRNELAAIMRDRFRFGQRGISIPLIVDYVYSGKRLPQNTLVTLQNNQHLCKFVDEVRLQAKEAGGVDNDRSLELGVFWIVNQGRQPSSIGKRRVYTRLYLSRIDPLARWWTRRVLPLSCDPFSQYSPLFQNPLERARVLDFCDLIQQGGTISDALMERTMRKRFCLRCRLATRCAVETFMESSVKSHADLRAKDWLRHISIQWKGNFERVIDVMWEACFIDQDANRLDGYNEDRSPSFGDRSKVTTVKTLGLLFMIARSLLGSTPSESAFELIAAQVGIGMGTESWWEQFWEKVANALGAEDDYVGSPISVDENARAAFKRALREMIDEDMKKILSALLERPVNGIICLHQSCELREKSNFVSTRL